MRVLGGVLILHFSLCFASYAHDVANGLIDWTTVSGYGSSWSTKDRRCFAVDPLQRIHHLEAAHPESLPLVFISALPISRLSRVL